MLILQQLVNGLMLGGVYVMVAVAFTLIIGMLNFLNFTIPALFMFSAVMMWATMTGHLPFGNDLILAVFGAEYRWIAGIIVALTVTALISLVIERFTYRYMKAKYGDATEHALPLVSSLGFLIIFEHLVISSWGSDPLSLTSPFGNATFEINTLLFSVPQLISLALSLLVVILLSVMLKATKLGRALRSIAERPDTATLMGVEVGRIVPLVYVITGLLCAISGVLFTINYTTIDAYVGDTVATVAIAGMVLGGLGNVWGAIVGGLFVGILEVMSIHVVGADFAKVPIWGLLLIILVVRPTGLFGHTLIGKGKF
ncbi:MAG: branched-chain amino acid ABC transporter permease [Rhodospirillaceae bacterium]|jgi:branched-chain amino acid transport system permease protein|nr:branched-chain amino acid ABC transporter permease [Rhodospirillaceae bacterium]MBT5458338.1 branched-chain amino acid ABC transporter permease [Rhodospirillaceae bacterium]